MRVGGRNSVEMMERIWMVLFCVRLMRFSVVLMIRLICDDRKLVWIERVDRLCIRVLMRLVWVVFVVEVL